VTVTPEASVEDVVRALRGAALPGVPVVTDSGRLLGIITESDLVMSGDEGDLHLPHFIELFGGIVFLESLGHFEERLKRATAAKARDMMTEDPVTIGPDADVHEAGRTIARTHHNRLPVVDDSGHLIGVVTRADVLSALTQG
jgi:CBS domain-containing protein